MIRVSLAYLVLIYLVLMLGPVFLAWIVNGWRRQRRENVIFRDVLRCSLCGFEFRDGTTLLGQDSTAPYSFTWRNVPVGSHVLTARATDNMSAVTTSSQVRITVRTKR